MGSAEGNTAESQSAAQVGCGSYMERFPSLLQAPRCLRSTIHDWLESRS